jgi:hypothetical protein
MHDAIDRQELTTSQQFEDVEKGWCLMGMKMAESGRHPHFPFQGGNDNLARFKASPKGT